MTSTKQRGGRACRQHDFDTWAELREFFEDDLNPAYMLFRGQFDSDWGLCTSLDRLLQTLPDGFRTEKVVALHLQRFIKAARGRRLGRIGSEMSQAEWWSLGQHYGLATPLLDWTESAYIATYFAFASPNSAPSGRRAIWAIVPNAIEVASAEIRNVYPDLPQGNNQFIETSRLPIVDFIDPTSDDNPRLINQAGTFTRAPILWNLENWVEHFAEYFRFPVLLKLTVSDDARHDVLRALQKMNIHSQSLFPDVSGASSYCNEMLSLQAETVTIYSEAFRLLEEMEKTEPAL